TATYTARVSNVGTAPAQLVEVQISGPGLDGAGRGPQFTSISATGGGFGNCTIQFPFIDPNDLSRGATNLGLCRSQSLAAGASGEISLVVNYTIPPQTQLPLRTGLAVQAFTPDVR